LYTAHLRCLECGFDAGAGEDALWSCGAGVVNVGLGYRGSTGRIYRELSKSLLEETGIDIDLRVRPSLALAFTDADVEASGRAAVAAAPAWATRRT
jgi:hypothetical protein